MFRLALSKSLLAAAVAAGAMLALPQAHARTDVSFYVGVPAPVYVQPQPVYVAPPPPVYVQPQPVYVQPAPVYARPAPVYVVPGYGWRGSDEDAWRRRWWRRHHERDWDD